MRENNSLEKVSDKVNLYFTYFFTLHKAHPYLNQTVTLRIFDAVIIDKMLRLLTFICSRNKQLVNICYSIQRETF